MRKGFGHCPKCSGVLLQDGNDYVCERGDYIVPIDIFDKLWMDFSNDPKKTDVGTMEKLLQDLINANTKS